MALILLATPTDREKTTTEMSRKYDTTTELDPVSGSETQSAIVTSGTAQNYVHPHITYILKQCHGFCLSVFNSKFYLV